MDAARETGVDAPFDVATADRAPDTAAPTDGSGDGALDAPIVQHCEAEMDLGTATGVGVASGTTRGAGDEVTPECSGGTAPDVIFRWQAPTAGAWVFDTYDSAFDTVLHVRDADCGLLACNDNTFAVNSVRYLRSRVVADVAEGETLLVAVDGAGSSSGNFVLSITPLTEETVCDDGLDNDRDGVPDCEDLDCVAREPDRCIERICDDGLDNDGDRSIDCGDFDCQVLAEPCRELTCGDGLDNDGDGQVDCADENCFLREPCRETTCGDGADNDGDGSLDCGDADCACSLACVPDSCPNADLGSVVGPEVARGTTVSRCDFRSPALGGGCHFAALRAELSGTGREQTYTWTAPTGGVFAFDTRGSDFRVMLYLRDGGCDGPELACDFGAEGTRPAVATADLAAGQRVVLVIDGIGPEDAGNYVLSITAEP